jgi:hypothetical protein
MACKGPSIKQALMVFLTETVNHKPEWHNSHRRSRQVQVLVVQCPSQSRHCLDPKKVAKY